MLFKQSLGLFQQMMVEVLGYINKNLLENRDEDCTTLQNINQLTIKPSWRR